MGEFVQRLIVLGCYGLFFSAILHEGALFVLPVFDAATLARLTCRSVTVFNELQRNICIELPAAYVVLTEASRDYADECNWQFRTSRFNCTAGGTPILFSGAVLPQAGTREAAFDYALASAMTAHSITDACAKQRLGGACGCDATSYESRNNWQWGGCGHDVDYGVRYAQRFMDARETVTSLSNSTDIGRALVNLHNNALGRRTLQDNTFTACTCHGVSGTCTSKTCWRQMPNMADIGDVLKEVYKRAVQVKVIVPRDKYGPTSLHYLDTMDSPRSTEMVYLVPNNDLCSINPNYTRGRFCVPKSNMTESLSRYYAPCEELCCDGRYRVVQVTRTYKCKCKFIWCCNVVCSDCSETVIQYKCTS